MACGHLPLMMSSYLVTKLVSKCRRGTATENYSYRKLHGADGLSPGEKNQKTLLGHTSLLKTK